MLSRAYTSIPVVGQEDLTGRLRKAHVMDRASAVTAALCFCTWSSVFQRWEKIFEGRTEFLPHADDEAQVANTQEGLQHIMQLWEKLLKRNVTKLCYQRPNIWQWKGNWLAMIIIYKKLKNLNTWLSILIQTPPRSENNPWVTKFNQNVLHYTHCWERKIFPKRLGWLCVKLFWNQFLCVEVRRKWK